MLLVSLLYIFVDFLFMFMTLIIKQKMKKLINYEASRSALNKVMIGQDRFNGHNVF